MFLGGEKMTVEERLDLIEFRQELLFENSDFTRTLFNYGVTRQQYKEISFLKLGKRYLNQG